MIFTFKHGDRPLEGYTVQRGVGRGGFGEVYYAVSDSGKEVALKYLRDNPQVELRGVSHCLNLKSPHLVTVHDIRQSAAGEHFIVMEYVSGPSLRDLLIAEGDRGLGVQKAAFFLREIAKGLGYLHDRGIVHRDLKPGNIFYEDGYVKIGDYGLSKFISVSQHSVQTSSVGTVHYMAPEVGSGDYGRGVDIYALGVILYEMLLGRVPYEGSSMGEVLMKHLTAQPEVDQLPAPFAEVIRRSLAKAPKDRYQTVDEMVEAVYGVDDIRNSVARLEPTNLSMAAARAVPAQVAAGVGGSSGQVNLPPGGAVAGAGSSSARPWQGVPTDTPRAGAGAYAATNDRPSPHLAGHRARIVDRCNEIDEHLRSIEKVRPGDVPRFPPRSRWVAGILGVIPFLGPLGVHRFYLGYARIGWIQLILTIVTSGTAGLWGMIEGVLILTGLWGRDVYGRPLVGRLLRVPVLQTRWIERVLLSLCVAAGLSAGITLVYHGPGHEGGFEVFFLTYANVLVFVIAMALTALAGSLLALRLRTPDMKVLGRIAVFGLGLVGLFVAAAICREGAGPLYGGSAHGRPGYFSPSGQFFPGESWSGNARAMALQDQGRMLDAILGGLAVSLLLANWTKRVQRGSEGNIELGPAIWAGLVAGVASLFWKDDYFVLAGGIAATASLTVQAAAIFRSREGGGPDGDDQGSECTRGADVPSPAVGKASPGAASAPPPVAHASGLDWGAGGRPAAFAVGDAHGNAARPAFVALAKPPDPSRLSATVLIALITGAATAVAFGVALGASGDRAQIESFRQAEPAMRQAARAACPDFNDDPIRILWGEGKTPQESTAQGLRDVGFVVGWAENPAEVDTRRVIAELYRVTDPAKIQQVREGRASVWDARKAARKVSFTTRHVNKGWVFGTEWPYGSPGPFILARSALADSYVEAHRLAVEAACRQFTEQLRELVAERVGAERARQLTSNVLCDPLASRIDLRGGTDRMGILFRDHYVQELRQAERSCYLAAVLIDANPNAMQQSRDAAIAQAVR